MININTCWRLSHKSDNTRAVYLWLYAIILVVVPANWHTAVVKNECSYRQQCNNSNNSNNNKNYNNSTIMHYSHAAWQETVKKSIKDQISTKTCKLAIIQKYTTLTNCSQTTTKQYKYKKHTKHGQLLTQKVAMNVNVLALKTCVKHTQILM